MKHAAVQAALHQLHESMRTCTRCLDHGHHIIPRAIFSGSLGAEIMLIGQAPGSSEVEAGRPFNAGSGQRLFQWLAEAGLNETVFREQQYMTAVTKCYPGKARNGGGDRVPTRQEQKLCRPFLEREIELINPRLILPVGRLAIDIFFPRPASLTQIIGQHHEINGRTIIPLPHPSGASRWHQIPAHRALIEIALEKISAFLNQPDR